MRKPDSQEKLMRFGRLLETIPAEERNTDSVVFTRSIQWLRDFPTELKATQKDVLRDAVCRTFNISQEELLKHVSPKIKEEIRPVQNGRDPSELEHELWRLIPRGFFYDYCEYTIHSETPLAFHLFTSLCCVGSVVGRRVWFDMGVYKLFPNLSVVLIAPSGICRKTTGTNLGITMLQELGIVKIYSEKMTPEALIDAMRDSASGVIYVPELAVFLNKQRYNEGLVPLLTRLLDNPDIWDSSTISRGKAGLRDVALSMLGGSTLDWFVRATPEDTFGGGFINRLMLVVQEDTAREESIPTVPDPEVRSKLLVRLANFKEFSGQMSFHPSARQYWDEWYHSQREVFKRAPEEVLTNYAQRRPDRCIKLAMLIHMAGCRNGVVCERCTRGAIDLVQWTEGFLPDTVRRMFQAEAGVQAEFVLKMVGKHGGIIDHSVLVRAVEYKMNAATLRNVLNSLKEGGRIREQHDATVHCYLTTGR